MRRFDDEDQQPEDLGAWLAAGWRRVEAQTWRWWNFTLAQAQDWRRAGVTRAVNAARWRTAGVDPTTVGDWLAAKIASTEAIRWREFGFDLDAAREHTKHGRGPDEAYEQRIAPRSARWTPVASQMPTRMVGHGAQGAAIQAFMRSGVPPRVLGEYLRLQWFDDEAIAWAKRGIQPSDAKTWAWLGLTPAEAEPLRDIPPLKVIEDWWRAGVPFAEVADWLGAGLSPEEAIEQRAAGVTVEQAAALRALRQGGLS